MQRKAFWFRYHCFFFEYSLLLALLLVAEKCWFPLVVLFSTYNPLPHTEQTKNGGHQPRGDTILKKYFEFCFIYASRTQSFNVKTKFFLYQPDNPLWRFGYTDQFSPLTRICPIQKSCFESELSVRANPGSFPNRLTGNKPAVGSRLSRIKANINVLSNFGSWASLSLSFFGPELSDFSTRQRQAALKRKVENCLCR